MVVSLTGKYAQLAIRDDADGVRWHVYKLSLDTEEPSEIFLRISADGTRAALTEKWSEYRERLLVELDRRLGAGRGIALRTRVDVMGGATVTVPPDWVVTKKSHQIAITDPGDEASFDVSHQPLPLHPRLPAMRARLELALTKFGDRDNAIARAVLLDRGDAELAWTDCAYETIDTKSGEQRQARCRLLLAANDAIQVLVTFAYWPEDASWAIPEWERIISTLRLVGRSLPADTQIRIG